MLNVDINKSHVNVIMLHVDIIYLACRGQKYATIHNNENSHIHDNFKRISMFLKGFGGEYTLISYEELSFVDVRIDERQPCMEDNF